MLSLRFAVESFTSYFKCKKVQGKCGTVIDIKGRWETPAMHNRDIYLQLFSLQYIYTFFFLIPRTIRKVDGLEVENPLGGALYGHRLSYVPATVVDKLF